MLLIVVLELLLFSLLWFFCQLYPFCQLNPFSTSILSALENVVVEVRDSCKPMLGAKDPSSAQDGSLGVGGTHMINLMQPHNANPAVWEFAFTHGYSDRDWCKMLSAGFWGCGDIHSVAQKKKYTCRLVLCWTWKNIIKK